MPLARFEPVFPTNERPQTHTLDRAVTLTGTSQITYLINSAVETTYCVGDEPAQYF